MWLKPDVLQRLDAYCAMYGVGRGRAIGHLLKGALPDPNWLPTSSHALDGEASAQGLPDEDGPDEEGADVGAQGPRNASRPSPGFQAGDRVTNNSGTRRGVIDGEPPRWIPSAQLASGERRDGHWSYAVAWDGQMGLTISYAEDLLRHADPDTLQERVG